MTQTHGMPAHDVDGVLRDYFRAEMPQPWPQAAALECAEPPVLALKRSRLRGYHRLALAASIALLVLSYLALAGNFSQNNGTPMDRQGGIIGFRNIRDLNPHRERLPSGAEGLRWEESVPSDGARPAQIINVQETKKPNQPR
ncbi:MAG: hypothetical protein HY040_13970 [Planctomycetes bacterium]|nr:hypothetical protein [Planctomycetota bacterium]